jgi:hypothetical protein
MRWKFVFGIFLLVLLLVNVGAQLNQIDNAAKKIEDAEKIITDDDLRADYLKQEWTKILNDTAVGPILNKADGYFEYSSPFFKIILGMPYSLSWLFFLSLFIYLLLILYLYRILSFFEPFYLKYGSRVKDYATLVCVAFISVFDPRIIFKALVAGLFANLGFLANFLTNPQVPGRFHSFIAFVIINFISGKGEWWAQLLAVFIVFGVILFLGYFSKNIEFFFSQLREERRKKDLQNRAEKEEVLQKIDAQKMARLEKRIDELEGKKGRSREESLELKSAKKLLIELGRELTK